MNVNPVKKVNYLFMRSVHIYYFVRKTTNHLDHAWPLFVFVEPFHRELILACMHDMVCRKSSKTDKFFILHNQIAYNNFSRIIKKAVSFVPLPLLPSSFSVNLTIRLYCIYSTINRKLMLLCCSIFNTIPTIDKWIY